MLRFVKVAGQEWPVYFGWNAFRKISNSLGVELEDIQSILSGGGLAALENGFQIAYFGVMEGFRIDAKENGRLNTARYTLDDIADLQDLDPSFLENVMEVFTDHSKILEEKSKKAAADKKKRPSKKP